MHKGDDDDDYDDDDDNNNNNMSSVPTNRFVRYLCWDSFICSDLQYKCPVWTAASFQLNLSSQHASFPSRVS